MSLLLCSQIFWSANIGYILNEIFQFKEEGFTQYFSSWENNVDSVISVVFLSLIVLRVGEWQWPSCDLQNVDECLKQNEPIALAYSALWGMNCILLWIRGWMEEKSDRKKLLLCRRFL